MNDIELCQELMTRAEEYQKRKEREFAIAELEKLRSELHETAEMHCDGDFHGENKKECSACKSDNSHENCLGCIEYGHWELKGENNVL